MLKPITEKLRYEVHDWSVMTLRRWSLKWNEVGILVLYLQTVYKRWTWSLKVNKVEIISSEEIM